ncbi:molybdopterin-dependent oxidoreductase [Halomarina salina]|uniref:Molybdopterin-dependent oxidoreductase n=1 Tax=Halomarina salina TaxID=1872699 RepID=A0ABD5RNW5_9EURY|nr:molybdopterin-dependent oxidoreductase [Halomarina salina]
MNEYARRTRAALPAVGVALAAGVAGVAGSYAVAGSTTGYVVAPVESALSQAMPGAVVTFAITTLGSLGQQVSLLTATLLVVGVVAALALGGLLVAGRTPPLVGALAAGVVVGAGAVLVTGAPLASLGAAVPVAVVLGAVDLYARYGRGGQQRPTGRTAGTSGVDPDRRGALAALAAAFAFGALGVTLGSRFGGVDGAGGGAAGPSEPAGSADTETLLAQASERSLDVEGLEPLVSDSFYNVDINAVDPTIDADTWTLTFTGNVAEEVSYDYDDLRAMDSSPEFVTLRCVGEGLNGKKMDNALWETVPVAPLLDEVGVGDENCCVMARAEDGFYEEFPLSALRNARIAYAMNSESLPRSHGAPARLLVPGHWGEINVKWLTELEILEEEATGYWEERGWHGTGPVNTVAKLHVTNHDDDGSIEVAGHAYAGTRGISKVEVSTDGGGSWSEARLSEELPGEDVWRQWAYRYDPPDGDHEVVVRAYDGEGTMQPEKREQSFPSGPSGWVTKTVSP